MAWIVPVGLGLFWGIVGQKIGEWLFPEHEWRAAMIGGVISWIMVTLNILLILALGG